MIRLVVLAVIATACASAPCPPPARESSTPRASIPPPGDPAPAQRAFDRLVALAGDWEAVEDGARSSARFAVIARGNALMQQSGFTAIYFRDGGTLMAALYPDDGHQARFRSVAFDEQALSFALEDATNLAPDAPHMVRFEMEWTSPDAIVQRWHWLENGRESVYRVELVRAAPQPESAPTPYTAEQIRAASRDGRTWEYHVENRGQPARTRTIVMHRVTDENVEIETSTRQGRRVIEEPERSTATWEELRQHALFPAASALVTDDVVTTPAGEFACRVYTIVSSDGLSRFFFARDLPGPPVLFYSEGIAHS